jgi:SpoVK/Ycf46/Vps4 family AAA+-type ATPase
MGYVQHVGGQFIGKNIELELTEKGYKEFLKEIDSTTLKVMKRKMELLKTPLTLPHSINPMNLFFNPKLENNLSRIERLLSKQNFSNYQKQQATNANMKGLTFLFHGGPGSGKTEYVLQLARKTKRPIMKIQVTDYLSKWVGDSESNIKRVFTDYRSYCDRNSVKPILFLNECDQIIGKRIETRSSFDQMSNGIQNVILEEMERFPGILIGTTNLVSNMDKAFERRWTYKLEFENPKQDIQSKIWKQLFEELTKNEIEFLTNKFDLTAGEITNIFRRFSVEKLLGFDESNLDIIIKLCSNERFDNSFKQNIGFNK